MIRILKSYFLILAASLVMLAFSVGILITPARVEKNVVETAKNEQSSKDMDTTVILTILSTIVLLVGMFKNPALIRLSAKVTALVEDNKEQHEQLTSKLAGVTSDVKNLSVYKDLEHSLAGFVDGELEHVSGELSEFISQEGKYFIITAKDISLGAFNVTSIPNIRVQLNKLMADSNKRAVHLGERFEVAHSKSQNECMDKFFASVEEIMTDDTFNSKHKRFKVVCEQALHKHLTDSIRAYFFIKTQ